MLKLASNCVLIVVLVMLSSCLKRPEKRAPRVDMQDNSQTSCASLDPAARALHTRCRPDPNVPIILEPQKMTKPTTTTTTTEVSPDEEVDEEEEVKIETPELDDNKPLANISVSASCESYGCLYRKAAGRDYWLSCEIKGGGCKKGFAVEVRTATGSPRVTRSRSSVCGDGDKTVADLSQSEIKLECKTDQEVMWSLAPKTAELILRRGHLAGRHVCVVMQAGRGQVADFKDAGFGINAGDCPADDNRIYFNMQLEFIW